MDAFILPKTIAYIFLSTASPTTLHFERPVEFMQAGNGNDFNVMFSKNKKTLVLRPMSPFAGEKNMVVISEDTHFHFKLMTLESRQHDFIYVHKGKENATYVKKFEDETVKIHEGDSSLYLINKSKEPIDVNGTKVDRQTFLSKGLPVLVNGRPVL
jgi:hypothetical protein